VDLLETWTNIQPHFAMSALYHFLAGLFGTLSLQVRPIQTENQIK